MSNFQIPPDIKQDAIVMGKFTQVWFQWFTKLVAKLNQLTTDSSLFVLSSRAIHTTAPLTGGGDLSADRTIAAGGLAVTIATAKLTGGGTNGSMTFVGGILTTSTPAT